MFRLEEIWVSETCKWIAQIDLNNDFLVTPNPLGKTFLHKSFTPQQADQFSHLPLSLDISTTAFVCFFSLILNCS